MPEPLCYHIPVLWSTEISVLFLPTPARMKCLSYSVLHRAMVCGQAQLCVHVDVYIPMVFVALGTKSPFPARD